MGGFWGGADFVCRRGGGGDVLCSRSCSVVRGVGVCVCVCGGGGDVGGDVGRCAGVLVWLRRVASGGV